MNIEEQAGTVLSRTVTRRDAVKAAGIAAVAGLAFSSPLIRTIRPTSAFAGYAVGKPSIEFADPIPGQIEANLSSVGGDGNDIVLYVEPGASSYTAKALFCNVSGHIPVTIDPNDYVIAYTVLEETGCSVASVVPPTGADIGVLTSPPTECSEVPLTVNLTAPAVSGCKVKVSVTVHLEGANGALLIVTFIVV